MYLLRQSYRLWLLAALPLSVLSEHGATLNMVKSRGTAQQGPTIDNTAMWRSIDELGIAQSAMIQAKDSSKSASASQKDLMAQQAEEAAHLPYDKIKALVPEARAQVLKVRKYALLARQHRDHTQLVETHYNKIEDDAVAEALKATIGWIKADADATAEKAATVDNRGDRLAAAVAAAAEPYHIALLRNQKFCEETYSKAKTAFSSMKKLMADAKKMALKAQELQAAGAGLDASSTKAVANGMMSQAEDLRQWANKMYAQANTACSSTAGYTLAEQQAATNAAMTTIINAPMKLPPKKL